MRRRFNDRLRAARRVGRLENAGADEVSLGAELHHQRRVRRGRDAARAEQHDRQAAVLRDLSNKLDRHSVLTRPGLKGVRAKLAELFDRVGDRADVCDRFDDVPGAGLALAADHRGALVDAAQRLTQVARSADKGNLERVLVDVIF